MTDKEINGNELGNVAGGNSNFEPPEVCGHCGGTEFEVTPMSGGRGYMHCCTKCHLVYHSK